MALGSVLCKALMRSTSSALEAIADARLSSLAATKDSSRLNGREFSMIYLNRTVIFLLILAIILYR